MSFWNLYNLRHEFRLMSQVRSRDQMTDDEINLRINRYYCLAFGLEATPRELRSIYSFQTDAGTRNYDKPAAVTAIIGNGYCSTDADFANGIVPIRYFTDSNEYPTGLYTTQKGVPFGVIDESGTLFCVPIPDKTYTITLPAIFKPAMLLGDRAEPLVQDWGLCIAAGAAYDYLMSVGNLPRAQEVAAIKTVQLQQIGTRNIINASPERNPSTW